MFSNDLDGDGDNDLAVANYNGNNVSILVNNGDGSFQAPINYDVVDAPYSVFLIDLDDDGDNDLVTANTDSEDISVLLNDGNADFQLERCYPAPAGGPTTIFSVDLDGDGDNDLVTANNSDCVSVFFNQTGPYGCCGLYTSGYTGNTNCDDQGKYNLGGLGRYLFYLDTDSEHVNRLELT